MEVLVPIKQPFGSHRKLLTPEIFLMFAFGICGELEAQIEFFFKKGMHGAYVGQVIMAFHSTGIEINISLFVKMLFARYVEYVF